MKKIIAETQTKEQADTTQNLYGRINQNGEINLSIVSINLAGVKNNTPQLNEYVDNYDIVVFQESWHRNNTTLKKCVGNQMTQA